VLPRKASSGAVPAPEFDLNFQVEPVPRDRLGRAIKW